MLESTLFLIFTGIIAVEVLAAAAVCILVFRPSETRAGTCTDSSSQILAATIRLENLVMATFDEVRATYKAYAQAQKDRADTAESALSGAQAQAQANADALAAFQADDAATDATQLADQSQSLADQLQSDLDTLQAVPVPDEPVEEPPVETPPAEEPAV